MHSMLKMYFAYFITLVLLAKNYKGDSALIQDKIYNYFSSDLYEEFNSVWQKYKVSYENSIKLTLQETFGRKSVNVFRQHYDERIVLTKGMFMSDNVVEILLQNLTLVEMPSLLQPDVTFNLPDHNLRVDGELSRIILEADYTLFRNRSSIIYSSELGPGRHSPFASSQVLPKGRVTIVASGCLITGETLATLSNTMVHLSEAGFKVYYCSAFFIEIYRPGTGHPPVMAPYFGPGTTSTGVNLGGYFERALTPVIASEMMKNLEGFVMATINTTAIFGADLMSRIRPAQKSVIRETSLYLQKLANSINSQTRQANDGMLELSPIKLAWDDNVGEPRMTEIIIDKMTLFGVDSAYSSAQGGPVKNPIITITDKIRFSTIQVRGRMLWKDNSTNGTSESHEFSLDIKDLTLAFVQNFNGRRSNLLQETITSKYLNKAEVRWR